MALAKRPGDILQNKRNLNPSLDPYTEARAEDFEEICEILNEHADRFDAMVQPAKFFGFHTSLPNLAAAYPTPEADGWAVIIPTNGNSPFVATFTNGVWTASEVQAPIQYFATKTARPPEGQEGIFYVVKDQKLLTLWYDNKYNDFGKDGANGMSAYEVAVAFGFAGTETEWLDSLKGKSAFEVAVDNGFSGTEAEWIASIEGVEGKSAYEVAVANGFAGTEVEWLDSLNGEPGVEGDSAYEVALTNGFVGTEAEWLNSLNGDPGTEGDSAYEVAVANGFVGTEAEWLNSLNGDPGAEGDSAYEVAVANGFVGTEAEWLASLNGGLSQDDIDEVIVVDTTRNFAATDIGKVLFITATVTLTYPAGGIPKFKCNIMCSETGLGTLAGQAAEMDFPDGKIIEARKAVTLFLRPDDSRLTGYGEFTA